MSAPRRAITPRRALPCLTALLALAVGGCGSSASSSSSSTALHSTSASSSSATGLLAGPAGSGAPSITAPNTVRGSAGKLTATMHAASHHPRVERPWPVSFTASRSGRSVHARVHYEYMFAGRVVAHRSTYTFTGRFLDVFRWPASAVGYPLTFRAVVSSAGASVNLDYAVQVAR